MIKNFKLFEQHLNVSTNSKGQKIHPTEDGIENFWKWFRNSKVVDSYGRPLVVYHGTDADFDDFDEKFKGVRSDHEPEDVGFHFSTDPEYADAYSYSSESKNFLAYFKYFGEEPKATKMHSSNIIPVYVRIENPEYLKLQEHVNRETIERAKSKGKDGIISDWARNEKEIVVFSPEQIKSSIGNTGKFDFTSNITENNSNNIFLYHGTNENITSSEIEPDKRLKGIYTSTSSDVAKDYGDNILRFQLKNNAKILNLSDGYIKMKLLMKMNDTDLENHHIVSGYLYNWMISSKTHKANYIVEQAKFDGYDVVKVPDALGGKGDDIAWIIINKECLIPLNYLTENYYDDEEYQQLSLFTEPHNLINDKSFLYHVTNIKNLGSIQKYGILPDFGETVRLYYSDYYDFDEPDWDEKDDERKTPIYQDIDGVSFFAETPLLGFSEFGFGSRNLDWNSMVLCVIRKNDEIFHKTDNENFTDHEDDPITSFGPLNIYNVPIFIEGGDWFSFETQTPEYVLYGENLKNFIKTNYPSLLKKHNLSETFSLKPTKRWYHYSDVNYLKIHLKPFHNDPAGFYMFPDDEIQKIHSFWTTKKFKFTLSLKPNLNILNLDKLTKKQEMEIITKLNTDETRTFKNDGVMRTFKNFYGDSSFWDYIRQTYGKFNGFVARKDFMRLGYDGIYSQRKIHSIEPQLIIFDLNNLNVEKVEKTKSNFWNNTVRMKDFVLEFLKNKNGLTTEVKNYSKQGYDRSSNKYIKKESGFTIGVKNKDDKSFSIKIYYELGINYNSDIHLFIQPYSHKRNYSMGTILNSNKPKWDDFERETIDDLNKAIDDFDE